MPTNECANGRGTSTINHIGEPGMPRGLRIFAPTSELYRTKGNYVKLEYPTLTFKDVPLEEVVLSNKKKGAKVTKKKVTPIGSCRGEEAI